MQNVIVKEEKKPEEFQNEIASPAVFNSENNFRHALVMAQELAKSDLIPISYKNKPANCLIAIELSNRLGLSPFMIMQNMHVIQGRPSWASTFIIACINTSGKFKGSLKFQMDDAFSKCRAYAFEKHSGEKLTGPLVTIEMAQAEGWLGKNGSKWKTMPELMLRYRAAAFFGRLYCPEIMNGMLTNDEVIDIEPTSQISKENQKGENVLEFEPEVTPNEVDK